MGRLHGARRLPGGGVRIRLSTGERDALASLPPQLLPLLAGEEDFVTPAGHVQDRLFPPAYDDALAEMEYRELTGSSLSDDRVAAVETFAKTLEAGSTTAVGWAIDLSPDEAHAWLSAANDARLVLGMVCRVTDEAVWESGPDPDDPASVMLFYLGWLQEELLEVLMYALED